jgi:hypothetical protein
MDLEATVREIAPDLLRFCIGASGETSAGEDLLIRIFGQLLNAGMLVDKSLEGRTVSLSQATPISKQLDEICHQASCLWKLSESPRRLLEVVPR